MREAFLERKTNETEVKIGVNLDKKGESKISTGMGFFDHMLELFAFRAGIGLHVRCEGDLRVDGHHTVEDVGIALGQAFAEAVGDKAGIARYGSFTLPMDEALASCHLDIGGRAYTVMDVQFTADRIGELDTQMIAEFFRAFANNAKITLHLSVHYGENDHHRAEALFKAFAHALRIAVSRSDSGLLSTKGVL